MTLRVIVNPAAAAGAARRRIPEISRALHAAGLPHDIVETRAPGHAAELARRAREEGVGTIGVAGGDGTIDEVAQAYLDENGSALPGPRLALLPAGTGGDFRRTFGFDGTLEDAVSRLGRGTTRSIDLGMLRAHDDRGKPFVRAFLNIASFGIGGLVDRIAGGSPKWLGGRAAYYLSTVRAIAVYRNAAVRIETDGAPWLEGPIVNVAIANGRYFGGGMMVAPSADASDGLFDIVALGNMTRLRTLGLTAEIYKGTHIDASDVTSARAQKIRATAAHPWQKVLVDRDGEIGGVLPLEAEVRPGAIELVV